MAANPISYQEIEAYSRLMRVDFTAFEVDLIGRLDQAVLAIWNKQSGAAPNEAAETIPISDTAALREMVRSTAAAHRMANEQRAAQRRRK